MLTRILCSLLVIFGTTSVFGQSLKRRAGKGFQIEKLTPERRKELGITESRGLYVLKVIPATTAEAAGIQEKDILLNINGQITESVDDVLQLELREGDLVSFTILRGKKEKTLTGKAIANPRETSESLNVEYSSFAFRGGQVSTVTLAPKTTGKKPAILFIPGLGCWSVDNLWTEHVYRKLVYGLADKGYVVMRSEKPGIGDSQNTPDCDTISFLTEVDCFRHAYDALMKRPDVDTNNVFIIGHSMGGMEAPFVAEGKNVKGIIAMGITVKPWLEYLTEMLRVQNPRLGQDYLKNEHKMKLYETLLFKLLVEKKTVPEMIAQNPEYETILKEDMNYEGGNNILTRSVIFSQTLNDVNVTDAWLKLDCKVLSAWGETDIQTINDFSHRELVRMINQYHPGNATFLELTDTDHNLLRIQTMDESYERTAKNEIGSLFPTHFNTEVTEKFHLWMQQQIK